MEALLTIIAGFIGALVVPMVMVVAAPLMIVGQLVMDMIAGLVGGTAELASDKKDQEGGKPQRKSSIPQGNGTKRVRKGRPWLRYLGYAFVAIAGLVLLVNFVFFDPAARFVAGRIENKTGYEIDFAQADGNIFTGSLFFKEMSVKRESGDGLKLDVTLEKLDFKADIWTLLSKEITLNHLYVSGVRGVLEPPVKLKKGMASQRRRSEKKSKKFFIVHQVLVSDVVLGVQRPNRLHELEITRAEIKPFRSKVAMFDLFFRSNLEASIDGVPLAVSTREISELGRDTQWRIEGLPIDLAGSLLPRAPLTWLEGGTISATVGDQWSLVGDKFIDMDWEVRLSDVGVRAPKDAKMVEKMLVTALGKAVSLREEDLILDFNLKLDRDTIVYNSSGDMDVFWESVKDQLINALAKKTGVKLNDSKDTVDGAVQGIKNFFNKPDE